MAQIYFRLNPQAGKCSWCGLWRGWGSPVLPCLGSSSPALLEPSTDPFPYSMEALSLTSQCSFLIYCLYNFRPTSHKLPGDFLCGTSDSIAGFNTVAASGPAHLVLEPRVHPVCLPHLPPLVSALDSRTPQLLELNVLRPWARLPGLECYFVSLLIPS